MESHREAKLAPGLCLGLVAGSHCGGGQHLTCRLGGEQRFGGVAVGLGSRGKNSCFVFLGGCFFGELVVLMGVLVNFWEMVWWFCGLVWGKVFCLLLGCVSSVVFGVFGVFVVWFVFIFGCGRVCSFRFLGYHLRRGVCCGWKELENVVFVDDVCLEREGLCCLEGMYQTFMSAHGVCSYVVVPSSRLIDF